MWTSRRTPSLRSAWNCRRRPAGRRVRALGSTGHIRGYRAEIDRHKIGLGVLAFVRLDAAQVNATELRRLEDRHPRHPEIVSCHYISGAGTLLSCR